MRRCPPGCPQCYANVRGRANYRGHRGFRPYVPLTDWRVTLSLKKPSAGPAAGAGIDVSTPANVCPSRPLLSEFLASPVYDDGTKRKLPSLSLFLHDGRLTAALNDKDNVRTAFVSGESLIDVLDALEVGLRDDCLGWRAARPEKKR